MVTTNSRLADRIAEFNDQSGITDTNVTKVTKVDGFKLYRSCSSIERHPLIYEPAICVIAQGRKEIHFGEQQRGYDPDNYLINSITMPVEAELLDVDEKAPYLGLSLAILRARFSKLL